MIHQSWARRLLPIFVVQVYLWATVALFAFGPWQWPLRDPGTLFGFLFAAHLALLVGYLSAAHRSPVAGTIDPERLIRVSLWVTFAMLPLTSYARTGRWIPDVIGGLADPGRAYAEAYMFTESGSNFAAYARLLLAPWMMLLFPLGIFMWARLSVGMRIMIVAAIALTVLLSVATGQRREIADLLIIAPFVILAAHWSGVSRLKRVTVLAIGVVAITGIVAFASYFVYSHVSRIGRESAFAGVHPITLQPPDQDNPLLDAVPDEMKPGALGLINYFSSAYYGLALTLDRPVQPMYGFGHSMFLTRNWARLSNDPAFESRSLPVQVSNKDGYKFPTFWCTAYPYFANDVGFWGVVVLMILVGRALALTWMDMLGGSNTSGVVMFSMLAILVFYLPATNRMLQDGEGMIAFYSWLLVWMGSRHAQRRVQAAESEV